MDNVAGLIMVQIISDLGSSTTRSLSLMAVVRPVCVAIGFTVRIVLIYSLGVKPAVRKLRAANISLLPKSKETQLAFVLHI